MATRAGYLLLGVLGVFSVAMVALQPVVWPQIWGGLLIVWLSMLPAAIYLFSRNRAPIPFLPAVGLYYLVFYGLAIFLTPLAYLQGDRVVLYERIALGELGWTVIGPLAGGIALMFAAFYLSRKIFSSGLPRFTLSDSAPHFLNALYWILIIASLAYRSVPALETIPSIGQFFVPAGYVGFGGLFLQWNAKRLPVWQIILAIVVVVPLDLYLRIRYLFITEFMFLAMFVAFMLWRCGRVRLLAGVVLAGIMLVPLYSATTHFRGGGETLGEKVKASFEGALSVLSGRDTQIANANDHGRIIKRSNYVGIISLDLRISPLVNRIGHVWIFQTVVERTPDSIPYWDGYTYRPLLTSLIPRSLYPGKPEERMGGEFGVRYGFTEPEANQTSYNIPWTAELYANFGMLGLFAGMTLFGILLGALDRIFNSPESNDLEFLIGLTIIFRLVYQESNFSVMAGALPLLFVALYLYFAIGPKLISRLGAITNRWS